MTVFKPDLKKKSGKGGKVFVCCSLINECLFNLFWVLFIFSVTLNLFSLESLSSSDIVMFFLIFPTIPCDDVTLSCVFSLWLNVVVGSTLHVFFCLFVCLLDLCFVVFLSVSSHLFLCLFVMSIKKTC